MDDENYKVSVMLFGLDNSSKTSILYGGIFGMNIVNHVFPTIGFNVETLQYAGKIISVYDVGGSERVRPMWRYIFIVNL